MAASPGPWKKRSVGGKALDIVAADGRWVATMANRPESADDADLVANAPVVRALLPVLQELAEDLVEHLERTLSRAHRADCNSEECRCAGAEAMLERARKMLGPMRGP